MGGAPAAQTASPAAQPAQPVEQPTPSTAEHRSECGRLHRDVQHSGDRQQSGECVPGAAADTASSSAVSSCPFLHIAQSSLLTSISALA
jgi:hypothetical protein